MCSVAPQPVVLRGLDTWQRNASRATNLPTGDYGVPNTAVLQEQYVDLGNQALRLSLNENILDVELVKPMCTYFANLTSNWYLQDIGVPYILSVIMAMHYDAFFSANGWVDKTTTQLLLQTWQKALNRKPKLRDSLSNGHGVAVGYAIYLRLMDQGRLPYLQSAEERRVEITCLLEMDIPILPISKYPSDGSYVDGSTIYHGTGYAASLSYNVSMLQFMSSMRVCGINYISPQKWIVCLQSMADLIYGAFVQAFPLGRGVSRQVSTNSIMQCATKTQRWFGNGDIYDLGQFSRHTSNDERCVTHLFDFTPYKMQYRNARGRITRKLEGFYTWFGGPSGDYDGYNITSCTAALETTINSAWANDLSINTNLRSLISFTDEPVLQWVQLRNDARLPLYLGGTVMSGYTNNWTIYNDAYAYRQGFGIASVSACLPAAHPYVDVVYTWQQLNDGQPLNGIEIISVIDRRARGVTYYVVPVLDPSQEAGGTKVRLALHGTLENNAIVQTDAKKNTATIRSNLIRNRFVQIMSKADCAPFDYQVGFGEPNAPAELCSNVTYAPPIPFTPASPSDEPGYLGAPPADPKPAGTPANGLQVNSIVGIEMNKTKQVYTVFSSSVARFQPPEFVDVGTFVDPKNWTARYCNGGVTVDLERFDETSKRFQMGGATTASASRLLRVAIAGDGAPTNIVIDGNLDPYKAPANICNIGKCVTVNQSFAYYNLGYQKASAAAQGENCPVPAS